MTRTHNLISLSMLLLLGSAATSSAEVILSAGSHTLLPDTPHQPVPIYATADETLYFTGVKIHVQIGDVSETDPVPVFSGTEGTLEGIDYATGTIWSDTAIPFSVIGEIPYTTRPQVGQSSLGFNFSTLGAEPDGLVATLYIDTTGFSSGSYPLLLSGTEIGVPSLFIEMGGTYYYPTIENGSILIAVPEPASLLLMLMAVGLFIVTRGRQNSPT